MKINEKICKILYIMLSILVILFNIFMTYQFVVKSEYYKLIFPVVTLVDFFLYSKINNKFYRLCSWVFVILYGHTVINS